MLSNKPLNIEIMKIYVVSHYYDNGESCEDYREYQSHSYYSTLELASAFFWDNVTSNYEGKYVLKSVVLDTQETNVLDESEYLTCHPDSYWPDVFQENSEPDDNYYPEYPEDYDPEENELIEEYLHSEGTNFKTFKEIDDEIEDRRQAMLMNDLSESLDDVLTMYEVRFDDGEVFASTFSLEEAKEIRAKNNFKFLSRSLHIYEITILDEWNERKIV